MTEKRRSNRHVKVFSTYLQSDIINAKMALERKGIEYYTQNENFASLYPAPGIGTVDFFVDQSDAPKAREALAPLIKGSKG